MVCRWVRFLADARELAYELLTRVAETDSYINLLLPAMLRGKNLSDSDRGLVQELSYGSLRWQLQYDRIVDELTQHRELSSRVRIILRLGLHQLFRMRIPEHAAINESVELAKRFEPRASGLINAVLRNAQRAGLEQLVENLAASHDPIGKLALRYSHPEWVVSALKTSLELDDRGSELESLLAANNETPLVNLAGLTEDALKRLTASGLEPGSASPIGFRLRGNPEAFIGTDVRVQDEGSQLVALALMKLAPESPAVLDMCSGPGGKSAVLQSRLGGGSLTCMEPNPARAKLVRDALGDSVAEVVVAPGQDAKKSSYDAVLLDAPCSGLGSLRRKPESRWRKSISQLPQLNKLQQELLDAGIDALKPGGVLLYSTCSPVTSETNAQIAQALEAHPDVELVDLKPVMSELSPQLKLNQKRKTVQLWTHLHLTDAMFMAALRKKIG